MAFLIAYIFAETTQFGLRDIGALLTGAAISAGAILGIVDKRRKDVGQNWKDLYEVKEVEVKELKDKVTALEGRMAFFESNFFKGFSEGIAEAIVTKVDEELQNRGK